MSIIKDFLGPRAEELDAEKQCLNRKPIDSLICIKFEDGHIHYQLPINTSVTEFVTVLYKECQKEDVQAREGMVVTGFKENPLKETESRQIIDVKAEPVPIKPKMTKKLTKKEPKNEDKKAEKISE